jgi:hypothetical protein
MSTLLVEPVPTLCPTLSGTKYSKRSDFVGRVTIRAVLSVLRSRRQNRHFTPLLSIPSIEFSRLAANLGQNLIVQFTPAL